MQWAVLDPLIEAVRPSTKVPKRHLRRTVSAIVWWHDNGAKWRVVPAELGPWWDGRPDLHLLVAAWGLGAPADAGQEQGVQLGMTFLDGTSIADQTASQGKGLGKNDALPA